MKRIVAILILMMMCSINVFATAIYTDQETGVEFALPNNWSEVPFVKDRQYLDAKFMNSDETAMLIYSSYDIAKEGYSKEETEELREYLNMSVMNIEDAKEFLGEEGYSDIEKARYNDVDYFKAKVTNTQTLNGQEYTVEQLYFMHFSNGWFYYFLINETAYYEYYDDFKFVIESVKYPYSEKIDIDESLAPINESSEISYYELFQQRPAVYVPIILIMLLITMVAYAIFPLIFACIRKKTITKWKYNLSCYAINAFVMFIFIIINGESSGSPYLLWTCVFSVVGTNILKRRQVLEGYQQLKTLCPRNEAVEGPNKISNNVTDEEIVNQTKEKTATLACGSCGSLVPNNSMFCHKCGNKICKED